MSFSSGPRGPYPRPGRGQRAPSTSRLPDAGPLRGNRPRPVLQIGIGPESLGRPRRAVPTRGKESGDDAGAHPRLPGTRMNIVWFVYRGLFADNPRAIYEGLVAR